MIATWMMYALTISALVAAAAMAAEKALQIARWQSRWVWVVALIASIVVPLGAPILQSAASTPRELHNRTLLTALGRPSQAGTPSLAWIASSKPTAAHSGSLDRPLLIGWAALSIALAGAAVLSRWHLQQRLRHARSVILADSRVHVTDDVGPAVIGMIHPRIYVPAWLLNADAATQATVLEHEHQHIRGFDPQLLAAALLVLALLPWNLPLWWQVRKLRLAIEIDCDARVLKGGRDAKTYGAVMLDTATRGSTPMLAATSLSEPASFLERRVRLMMTERRRRWMPLTMLLFSGSAALLAAATSVSAPAATASFAAPSSGSLPLIPSPLADVYLDTELLAAAIGHLYPQLSQAKQAGAPYVWAVVNSNGEVVRSELEILMDRVTTSTSRDYTQGLEQRFGVAGGSVTVYSGVPLLPGLVGPDFITVSWIVQSDAPAMDPSAPRFPVLSNGPIGNKVLARLAAERAVIEHFDNAAMERGLAADQELWFLMDAGGRVLKAGRRARIVDPELARADLQTRFPGTRVSYVTQGTGVKDRNNQRMAVSWQWLASDSLVP